jgi:hypothetical protein
MFLHPYGQRRRFNTQTSICSEKNKEMSIIKSDLFHLLCRYLNGNLKETLRDNINPPSAHNNTKYSISAETHSLLLGI